MANSVPAALAGLILALSANTENGRGLASSGTGPPIPADIAPGGAWDNSHGSSHSNSMTDDDPRYVVYDEIPAGTRLPVPNYEGLEISFSGTGWRGHCWKSPMYERDADLQLPVACQWDQVRDGKIAAIRTLYFSSRGPIDIDSAIKVLRDRVYPKAAARMGYHIASYQEYFKQLGNDILIYGTRYDLFDSDAAPFGFVNVAQEVAWQVTGKPIYVLLLTGVPAPNLRSLDDFAWGG